MTHKTKRGLSMIPHVLLLEDNADTLKVLGNLMSAMPADMVLAATCAEARHAFATSGPFDVIIADANLPDGDGVDLAILYKRSHGCKILILSGSRPPVGRLQDGLDVWLTKPANSEQLRDTVRRLTYA